MECDDSERRPRIIESDDDDNDVEDELPAGYVPRSFDSDHDDTFVFFYRPSKCLLKALKNAWL